MLRALLSGNSSLGVDHLDGVLGMNNIAEM